MTYQVVIVESQKNLLDAISNILKQSADFEIMSTYGNVNDALGQSGVYHPNLFLIDVDDAETLKMLPAFMDIFPNAVLIGTMSLWNHDVAHEVLKGGAHGCILKPFKAKELLNAIRLYQFRGKPEPPRIISFFSPKGRSGRTTLASLLALTVARKTDEAVALIDADLQFGDLPIFFDVEPKHTVVDAVHDVRMLTPVSFAPYFHKLTRNVYMLSSPDRPEYAELVDAESLISVVRLSGNLYKYVFIDLPAGFNPLSIAVSNFADTNFVVAMINTGLEIEHVKRSMRLFETHKVPQKKSHPIFTRVNPCNDEQKLKLEMQIGYNIAAIFPNEYNLVSIANSGQILHGIPKDTLMSHTIENLADKIIGGEL